MNHKTFILGLTALLLPASVSAYEIDPESMAMLCGIVPCSGAGGGSLGLSVYLFDRIVTALEVGIIAAAILSIFAAAVRMVMFSSEENTVTESRTSFIYIITGLAIIGLARWFVLAFSPAQTGSDLVDAGVVESGIGNIVTYFKLIIAVSLLVNIVAQAFRLITSQGQQESVEKAKKRFIAGFIGAGIIMLANVIVAAIVPGFGGSTVLAVEIAGIANYMLVILGFMAVLAIVTAGVMLIVSVDEGLKDKAKSVIKTAIVALIVVLTSYALVTAFILI
ncbi:MAG: hypothetical protein HOO67_04215 [Candidatus Peribacteraceae bacterium]|nr:hypothetical protein [Candidatus Peribacteraceae bacterium]